MSNEVVSLKYILEDGSLFVINKGEEFFNEMVVSLGAFGVICEITLKIIPSFQMVQHVFEDLSLKEISQNSLQEIMTLGYSVSLFLDWKQDIINEIWIKSRKGDLFYDKEPPKKLFNSGTLSTIKLHPIKSIDPIHCTNQGQKQPWYQILPHFKFEFNPSSGEEIQSEFFIPFEYANEAIIELNGIRDHFNDFVLISEIRCIAKDDLWMSPCFENDSIGIHFTWKKDVECVKKALTMISKTLERFNPKPHFSKIFMNSSSNIQEIYGKGFKQFVEVSKKLDPKNQFLNEFLENLMFPNDYDDSFEEIVEVIVFDTELLHVGLSIGTLGFDFWFPETKQQAKVNKFLISTENDGRGLIKEKKLVGKMKSKINEEIQNQLIKIEMEQYDLISNNCHNYVIKALAVISKVKMFEKSIEYDEITKYLNELKFMVASTKYEKVKQMMEEGKPITVDSLLE